MPNIALDRFGNASSRGAFVTTCFVATCIFLVRPGSASPAFAGSFNLAGLLENTMQSYHSSCAHPTLFYARVPTSPDLPDNFGIFTFTLLYERGNHMRALTVGIGASSLSARRRTRTTRRGCFVEYIG